MTDLPDFSLISPVERTTPRTRHLPFGPSIPSGRRGQINDLWLDAVLGLMARVHTPTLVELQTQWDAGSSPQDAACIIMAARHHD